MNAVKRLRRIASTGIAHVTAFKVGRSWQRQAAQGVRHGLPGRLHVTLTSYPPRYPTLGLTLKSLLAQTVQPDELLLWIAEADLAQLPDDVRRLEDRGVTIRTCEDIRSYKKIIPLLREGGDAFALIADDDVYYPPGWLKGIVEAWRPGAPEVICTRAHRMRVDADGQPLPYLRWQSEIEAGPASPLVFATGIGGVLYPPGIFHPDVTQADLFRALCPTTDDIWLYWMAALNGARFRKVGPRVRPITWANSQSVALAFSNASNGNGNDEQIRRLIAHYGVPHWTRQG